MPRALCDGRGGARLRRNPLMRGDAGVGVMGVKPSSLGVGGITTAIGMVGILPLPLREVWCAMGM